MRSTHAFLTLVLLIFVLSGCDRNDLPSMPMKVGYQISSQDTAALGLVNTYFGERMDYVIYDSTHILMEREALVGKLVQWYDGDNLWIRQQNGDYCSCIHLQGPLLEMWRQDEWIQDFSYDEDVTNWNGWKVNEGIALDDLGDTTWIALSTEIPNAWFENPTFTGLPMRYEYNLRGAKVTYAVDSVIAIEGEFDPIGYDHACVSIPAEAYLGFAPNDTVFSGNDRIWVYGNLLAESGQLLSGDLTIEAFDGNETVNAKYRVDQGIYDIELKLGVLYTLDFHAAGMVHKRFQIDTRNLPAGEGDSTIDLSVALFEPENAEVDDYLASTNVGAAYYSSEVNSMVFDLEYIDAVQAEIARLRVMEDL